MLVEIWMSTKVITLDDETSMLEASQIMRENKIRRLPIVNKSGKLVGIVSDRDIKDASPSKATTLDVHELYYLLSKLKLKDVMTKNPLTISPKDTVIKAAAIMLEKRISGLPVVDKNGDLVGILTQGDVFKVLASITGAHLGGILLAFELEDRPGSLKEVADVIRAAGGSMTAILTSYEKVTAGHRKAFFRIRGVSKDKFPGMIAEMKEKFNFLYSVEEDLTPKK